MAIMEIKQYPEPVLKKKSKPVSKITPELLKLIDDMAETMYAAPGVGLAAPQVGVSIRLAVIDISMRDEESRLFTLINPEYIHQEGEVEDDEGCLSIKEYTAPVKRFAKVIIRATDKDGSRYEITAEGLMARAIQHELDHLDGLLFIDRISPLRRDLYKRRLRKQKQEEAAG